MPNRLLKSPLVWLLVLAVGVRVVALLILQPTLDFILPQNAVHGSETFDAYAQNLVATGVYGRISGVSDALLPPLYPYALSVVYGLFGRSYWAVGAFHTLLDLLAMAMLYDIGRRLFRTDATLGGRKASEWVGLLGGLCYAVYPYLIFQNLTVIDTPLWIFFLHGFVWLGVLLREQPALNQRTWGIAFACGVMLGLGTLTRPITPPLALLLALWFVFRLSVWHSFIRLLPVALVSVLVVVPWIGRNHGVYQAFVPMTITSGANYWQGNSEWVIPLFRAGYDVQWTAPDPALITHPPQSREADAQRFALAVQFLRDNPHLWAELTWVKFMTHWSIDIMPRRNPQVNEQFRLADDGTLQVIQTERSITGVTSANVAYDSGLLNTIGRPVHVVYFGGLLMLSIIGVLLSGRLWREVSWLWLVQFSMTFVYVAFHPSTRYRVPSDPLLFLFAAYAVVCAWQWWQSRQK